MHFYVIARGIAEHIRDWASELGHNYCKFWVKNPDGKKELRYARVQVRELKLYEIVFPETAEAEMMGMIDPSEYKVLGKWTKIIGGLSRMLGLKKMLPRNKWKTPMIPLERKISLMPLGKKKDKINWVIEPEEDVHALGYEVQEEL